MNTRPTHYTSPRRSLSALAAAASLALLGALATGCMDVGSEEEEGSLQAASVVDCSQVKQWTPNTNFTAGQLIRNDQDGITRKDILASNKNKVFKSLLTFRTFTDDSWQPGAAASLWSDFAVCAGAGQNAPPPVVVTPPAPPPPATQPTTPPPATQPTAPPPGGFGTPVSNQPNIVCTAAGLPGPKFDVNGDKNIGNGHHGQFIGGRCLSDDDCASFSCAGPCGICSGPAVCFAAGKTGCGFPGHR